MIKVGDTMVVTRTGFPGKLIGDRVTVEEVVCYGKSGKQLKNCNREPDRIKASGLWFYPSVLVTEEEWEAGGAMQGVGGASNDPYPEFGAGWREPHGEAGSKLFINEQSHGTYAVARREDPEFGPVGWYLSYRLLGGSKKAKWESLGTFTSMTKAHLAAGAHDAERREWFRKLPSSSVGDLGTAPTSLTYGTLPDKVDIESAMDGKAYNYSMGRSDSTMARHVGIPSSGTFDSDELYSILEKLVGAWEEGDDHAGDFASGILETLGFEWV